MHFETHSPEASIAPYIESIFHFKGFIPDHTLERVIPTGHLFLLFALDGKTRHTYDPETHQPSAEFHTAWLSGMHREHLTISAHENSEMFVIQFKCFGSHPFLHVSCDQFNDQVVLGDSILNGDLFTLHSQLLTGTTSADKFMVAEQWLLQRFSAEQTPPVELVSFIEALQAEPFVKISSLIEEYPTSHKHLLSQCKQFIGLTPKALQRILRFNTILAKIQQKQSINWAEVAYECGYSDQPHFIREFQKFSGMKPEEFIGKAFQTLEPNFFPLD